MTIAIDLFKRGMRRLGGGVTIVTTEYGDEPAGLTATAVCSLSAEPQRLLACINRGGATYSMISTSRRFCVNVLSVEHEDLAACFAGMVDLGEKSRFEQGKWTTIATGAPALDDALVAFDCRVSSIIDTGSHAIIIGDILGVRVNRDGPEPLLYMDGEFSTLMPISKAKGKGRAVPKSSAA